MKRFIASAAALLMLLTGLIALEPKAEAAGSAPVAANLELTTYRGVSVGGQLAAYDPDGGEVEIKLDPLLTPQQNAAKYYKEYNKAKTAESILTLQLYIVMNLHF